MRNTFLTTENDPRRRVLSYEEAIAGVDGDPYMQGLKRRASAGLPWSLNTGGMPGKTKWLGTDGDYRTDHPDLKAAVTARLEAAKRGERIFTLFQDVLKDEVRPHAKVDAVKTRVISSGPMDYVILFRQYFLGFCAHIMTNRIDNEIAIGINPISPEWDKLAKYLQQFGPDVLAGDFGNYDGCLPAEVLYDMIHDVNAFYDDGPLNARIRTVLWLDVVNSVHLVYDTVYMWTHSNPSGHPATTQINSIANSKLARFCWIDLMSGTKWAQLYWFRLLVAFISYGDDNAYNVAKAVLPYFNQTSLTKAYAKLGMKYTDEQKSDDALPSRLLKDITFLKRAFRWDAASHLHVAPLEMDSIIKPLYWNANEKSMKVDAFYNADCSLAAYALHPEEVYEEKQKWISKICMEEFGKAPVQMTYEDRKLKTYEENF
jgi:hypothetical protein